MICRACGAGWDSRLASTGVLGRKGGVEWGVAGKTGVAVACGANSKQPSDTVGSVLAIAVFYDI